jgi:hypothetical protein
MWIAQRVRLAVESLDLQDNGEAGGAHRADHFDWLVRQSRGVWPKRDANQFVNDPCWL